MPDNESVFNFDNRFQMNFNLTLCKGIYCLTNAQDDYEENMTKLNSLSSYSEKKLINTLPTLDEKFPLLSKIIIYVYMSKCSYRKLLQSDSSMKNYLQENITVTQYGNYADDIQKCLQKNAASYTSYERPLAPMYPLQNKIILFDKDIIKNCIDIIHPPKKDDHASAAYYSSQIHFTRILNKFRTLAKILFPEITEKRKSYQIPIFSLPALTFIFQTYHNKHLSTETRFSVLCDAFINIAVSKGLDLPSILNIIYLLKKGFEKSRTFSTGKDKDNKFLEFFKNPPSKSRIDDLNMQDLNVVHSRVFAEYQEMEKFYSSKISFMEDYRKIENVILSAYASWQDNFKNSSYAKKRADFIKQTNNKFIVTVLVDASDLMEYLQPAFPISNLEYYNLENAIERFLSEFQYDARQYKPMSSDELFGISKKLTILDRAMFDTLQSLIYSPGISYSNDISGMSSFFSPLPLSEK